MPISAASEYSLSKLHQRDPAFLESALADVAKGDALALRALQEKTGIESPAELQEAARLYLDHQLDALFAGAGDARIANTTGAGGNARLGAGGVAGARMNAFVGLRGGGADTQILAGALKLLVGEKARLEAERGPKDTQRTELQAELGGLHLNRRERFLGGMFAGILGADSEKADKGKALRGQIEGLDEQIGKLDRDIAGVVDKMHDTTAKHLKKSGDARIERLDGDLGAASEVLSRVDTLLRSISSARSAISSAEFAESQERRREEQERMEGKQNQPDFNFWSSSAVSTAESHLRNVRSEAADVEQALRRWGQSVDIGTIHTTDTGNSMDQLMDMMGHHGNGYFFDMGSNGVMMNLSRADGELMSLESRVGGVRRGVAASVEAAANARASYLDAVQAEVLAT